MKLDAYSCTRKNDMEFCHVFHEMLEKLNQIDNEIRWLGVCMRKNDMEFCHEFHVFHEIFQ
jgi:hypothetical protein